MKHGKTFSVLIAMLTWRSSLSIRGGLHRQFEEQQQQWESMGKFLSWFPQERQVQAGRAGCGLVPLDNFSRSQV